MFRRGRTEPLGGAHDGVRRGRLRRKALRIALSIAAVAVATVAVKLIHAEWGAIAFEPLVGAVILVALLAGPRTAILAAILAGLASITLVLPSGLRFDTGDSTVRAEWLTTLAVLPLVVILAYVVRHARDTAL